MYPLFKQVKYLLFAKRVLFKPSIHFLKNTGQKEKLRGTPKILKNFENICQKHPKIRFHDLNKDFYFFF